MQFAGRDWTERSLDNALRATRAIPCRRTSSVWPSNAEWVRAARTAKSVQQCLTEPPRIIAVSVTQDRALLEIAASL